MKIKNVKPGDILTIKERDSKSEKESQFYDHKWKVEKVYPHHVLTSSVKLPQIRRCFSYGDLVIMHKEHKFLNI